MPQAKAFDNPLQAASRKALVRPRRFASHSRMEHPSEGLPATEPSRLDTLMLAVGTRGDRQAFAALFDHFAPRVKAYLLRQGCPSVQAEELLQETMIMVWRKASGFDPRRAAASTWVFTIARNKMIDALRRDRRPEWDPADPTLVPAEERSGEAQLAGAQDSARLRRALHLLPEEQAKVIHVAYFDDKAHSAIAAELNLPLGTVKSRLRLALARLRRALEDEP